MDRKRHLILLLDEVERKAQLWAKDPRPAFRQQLSVTKEEIVLLAMSPPEGEKMTHDTQIHNLQESLMDAYASAYMAYHEYASHPNDSKHYKEVMETAKEGAVHVLKGAIQEARDCLKKVEDAL